MTLRILDCTLRDGGFINDWKFGLGSMKSIISRLDKAGIDIVEVGFIDDRRDLDPDRAILPSTEAFNVLLSDLPLRHSMIVAMVDYGTCDIANFTPRSDCCIDGIRVMVKKNNKDDALEFCKKIKQRGYKVFVQPVSVTGYSDVEFVELIENINKLDPYLVSIVDTYGLMHDEELFRYFKLLDKNLNEEITIGYHSHNNFQLAYSNSIKLTRMQTNRNVIVDGSLYGMGKSAGNTCTELLAMYFNNNYNKNYDIGQLLEIIDVDIMREYDKSKWGYSLLYFIASSNRCHPNYVKYLIDKKTLSINSINLILKNIPTAKKLIFDRLTADAFYGSFIDNKCDDALQYKNFANEIIGRNILLLGPGKTLLKKKEIIKDFIIKKTL